MGKHQEHGIYHPLYLYCTVGFFIMDWVTLKIFVVKISMNIYRWLYLTFTVFQLRSNYPAHHSLLSQEWLFFLLIWTSMVLIIWIIHQFYFQKNIILCDISPPFFLSTIITFKKKTFNLLLTIYSDFIVLFFFFFALKVPKRVINICWQIYSIVVGVNAMPEYVFEIPRFLRRVYWLNNPTIHAFCCSLFKVSV